MTSHYVLVGTGQMPLALIRVGDGYFPIERWQPEAGVWFEAPWHLDDIAGADRWRTKKITADAAQEIEQSNPFGMVDMPQDYIDSLNRDWAKPPAPADEF